MGVAGPSGTGKQGAGLQPPKADQPECFLCFQDFTVQEGHRPQDLSVGHGETSALRATSALKARWWPCPGWMGSAAMAQVLGLAQKAEQSCYGNHLQHGMGRAAGRPKPLCFPGQERHQERTCAPGHYCPQGTHHLPLTCPPDMSSSRQGQSQAQGCWPRRAGEETEGGTWDLSWGDSQGRVLGPEEQQLPGKLFPLLAQGPGVPVNGG